MYTILITDSNELVTSERERIMQRSKLVDTLRFLTDPKYKSIDMSDFVVLMEYVLPVSREYHSEFLVQSEELYKNKLEYRVPFDTALTREAGDIEVQISFIKSDLDDGGKQVQYVRKTSATTITIVPISAWSDLIPDASLTSLDQRIIKTESMIHELREITEQLNDDYDNKADNLSYEDNKLQLMSGNKKIGDEITISGTDPDNHGGDGTIEVIKF